MKSSFLEVQSLLDFNQSYQTFLFFNCVKAIVKKNAVGMFLPQIFIFY